MNKQETKDYQRQYRLKNKEKFKQYIEKYNLNHRIKIKKYLKKYGQVHKKRLKQLKKQYQLTHRKEIAKNKKEYYLKNKKRIQLYLKNYYLKNKKIIKNNQKSRKIIINKQAGIYQKNKLKTNLNFKLTHYLRCRIRTVLLGLTKSDTTRVLVGCSVDFLKQHLEKQFKRGMSWKNYGKWHIDHIKPCASFDLSDPEQQKQCFSYTNLQPLWASENLSKGKKIKEN